MVFLLEIVGGNRKGTRFSVADGMSIGRKRADILLQDPKASGKHAVIEMRSDGFYVVDQLSSNGIRVQGRRVPEVKLEPDVEFRIGSTVLRVLDANELLASSDPNTGYARTWNVKLADFAERMAAVISEEKREQTAFNPLLKLKFTQGIQAGTEWVIGYGPRQFGPDSLDFVLSELGVPGICFELQPKAKEILFTTDHPELVRLNGRSLATEKLHAGDVIEIKNTRIEVEVDG